MSYDRHLSLTQENALRADLQARADMLEAATRDLARQTHCMVRLEGSLMRWLMEHRQTFGDRFCTHALLSRLPLPEAVSGDRAEARLRRRVATSQAMRPACFRAIALRRDRLGRARATEAQIATRVHSRACAMAGDPDWAGNPLDTALAALDAILSEGAALSALRGPDHAPRL